MPVDLRAELQGIKKAIDKGICCPFCIGYYRDVEHKHSCPVSRLSALLAEAEAPKPEPCSAVLLPRAEVEALETASEALLVWLDDSYPHLAADSTVEDFRSALALLDRGQTTPASSGGGQEVQPGDWECSKGCGWSQDSHEQCGGECPVDEALFGDGGHRVNTSGGGPSQ